MNKLEPSEYQIQSTFIEYVRLMHPEQSQYLIHIPNEGKRSLAEGRRQKALGLTRGVFDLFFASPRGGFCGLWIEVKSKGGRISKEQKAFQILMAGHLHFYEAYFAYSVEDCIEIFEDYLYERTNSERRKIQK